MENQEEKVDEAQLSMDMRFEKINIDQMGQNRAVLKPNECTCGGHFDEDCYCGGYSEDYIDVVVKWNNGTFTFHPDSPNNVHDLFWHIDDHVDFPVLAEIAAVPIYLAEGDCDPCRCLDTEHLKFVSGRVFFSWREPAEPVQPCNMKEINAR
jgi:hypothetical protein